MGEEPADVPAGHVGQPGVADLVEEERLVALPEGLVHVHPRAVVLEDRLRHERRREAVLTGHVLDDVLVEHQLVGHRQQRVEPHVDLGLAGRAHLVVLHLDLHPEALHRQDHLRAQILEVVHRRDGEVALLVPRLVAEVGPFVAGRVPRTLHGVDLVERRSLVLHEADVVEHVELGLGPEVGGVGEAGRAQVLLGLLGDVAGVTGVRLAGDRIAHEAVQDERLVPEERIDHGRVRVGHEDHVRLLDLLEPADRRAVEAVPLLEGARRELVGGDGEVLHETGEVAEAEVDDLDALRSRPSPGRRPGSVQSRCLPIVHDGSRARRAPIPRRARRVPSRTDAIAPGKRPVCTRSPRSAGLARLAADGTAAGLRPALGRRAGRAARSTVVHRRAGPAEELRHQSRRTRERPRRGHDHRRLGDRRVLPGAGERRAGPAGRQQLRDAPVGRCPGARGPDLLRHPEPRRHAVRGRPPPRPAPQPRPGPAARLHALRRPGDGVLLLRARRRRSSRAARLRLVLRPHHGGRRRVPAQAHDPDPRGDGHPGRVLVPRGLAEPARDRPPPHRRPHDGRRRHDVPAGGAGGGDGGRAVRHVHAQAARGRAGLGDAHPREPVRGRPRTPSTSPAIRTSCRRSPEASSPVCCTTPARSRPSPTRR